MMLYLLTLVVVMVSTSSAEWGQHENNYQSNPTENYRSTPDIRGQSPQERRYDLTGAPSQRAPSLSSFFPIQRRDVPDALIDPYSILGVLSFTVYISYILYHRYQMGHKKKDQGPSGTPAFFSAPTSDQNLAYLIDVATKILQNAEKQGAVAASTGKEVERKQTNNGTISPPVLETLDYYDEDNETDPGSRGEADLRKSN